MAEKKTLPRVERVEGEERKKALSAALAQIEKQFGKGSIMRMGDKGMSEDIDVVSTGSLGLDLALGVGGLPRGRIIEIYGPARIQHECACFFLRRITYGCKSFKFVHYFTAATPSLKSGCKA